ADPGFGDRPAPSRGEDEDPNAERDGNNYGEYAGLGVFGGIAHPAWTDARKRNFAAGLDEEVYASSATVTVTGTAGNDTTRIALDPTGRFLQIFEGTNPAAAPVFTALRSAVWQVVVNGLGGNDTLIVTAGKGGLLPSRRVTFTA